MYYSQHTLVFLVLPLLLFHKFLHFLLHVRNSLLRRSGVAKATHYTLKIVVVNFLLISHNKNSPSNRCYLVIGNLVFTTSPQLIFLTL